MSSALLIRDKDKRDLMVSSWSATASRANIGMVLLTYVDTEAEVEIVMLDMTSDHLFALLRAHYGACDLREYCR